MVGTRQLLWVKELGLEGLCRQKLLATSVLRALQAMEQVAGGLSLEKELVVAALYSVKVTEEAGL